MQDPAGENGASTNDGGSDTAARVAEAVQAALDALPAQQQAAMIETETALPPSQPAPESPVQDAAAGQATHFSLLRSLRVHPFEHRPEWQALQRLL